MGLSSKAVFFMRIVAYFQVKKGSFDVLFGSFFFGGKFQQFRGFLFHFKA